MSNNFKNLNKGLTLVELMVVISIFLVITGVTIFEYGNFRSNVSLQNLADDIALSIRKAQGFAIGAKAVKDADGKTNFDNSFGIHFSVNSGGEDISGTNKSFLMFSVPPTASYKKYNYNGGEECGSSSNDCIELFRISTMDYIKEIIIDGAVSTSNEASLDIVFTRPEPRAYFCYRETENTSEECKTASSVGRNIIPGIPSGSSRTRSYSQHRRN